MEKHFGPPFYHQEIWRIKQLHGRKCILSKERMTLRKNRVKSISKTSTNPIQKCND
jgi:hypothetical protein